jgi:DsbC/DsbD-like thiol-disulfide interchange protein
MKFAGWSLWVLVIAGLAMSRVAPVRLAAQEADQQVPPVRWTLAAFAADGTPVRRGATVTMHLNAAIEPGWHIYSLHEEPGGPMALRISVPPKEPFAMSGDVDAPAPKSAIDPAFGMETHFYTGDVGVRILLRATRKTLGPVAVDVFYQACTREMCLRPTAEHLTAAVTRNQETKR